MGGIVCYKGIIVFLFSLFSLFSSVSAEEREFPQIPLDSSKDALFETREDAGYMFHNYGLQAASEENNDPESSLAFFRGAVKAMPKNAEYQNDLGVTEANLGMLELARMRFAAALNIDSTYSEAIKNFKRVSEDIKKSKNYVKPRTPKPLKHRVLTLMESEFPNISGYSDRPAEFEVPFVVRNAIQKLSKGRSTALPLLEYLDMFFANDVVDYYPQNMDKHAPGKLYFLSLKRVMDQFHIPDLIYKEVDASLPGAYAQWNMNQTNWENLLAYLRISDTLPFPFNTLLNSSFHYADVSEKNNLSGRDPFAGCLQSESNLNEFHKKTHWLMMLLGEDSSGMYNHQDQLGTDSFQIQLQGSKLWNLCPPEKLVWNNSEWVTETFTNGSYMYTPGDIDTLSSTIDYKKFKRFVNATCFQVTVNAGDLLYYPRDYWHQTMNLETPSIAISSNLVTASSQLTVKHRLAEECDTIPLQDAAGKTSSSSSSSSSRRYSFSRDLCEDIKRCTNTIWRPHIFSQ